MKKREKEVKEGKQKKGKKKRDGEEYIPIKPMIGEAPDYHIYMMDRNEKAAAFFIGLAAGTAVVYIFFRNLPVGLIVGIIAGIKIQPFFRQHLLEKRKQELLLQFRDLLETLTASYSAGSNTREAFQDAIGDMSDIYGENADMVLELQIIAAGMNSNLNIEELLDNLAQRSGLDDIESFANVFEISMRQGTNIKNIVSSTRQVISDKIDMEMQIKTLLTSNQNELNVMLVMPFVIMLALSGMSDISIVSNTPINVVTKIICIGIFFGAYMIGKKIVDIKI